MMSMIRKAPNANSRPFLTLYAREVRFQTGRGPEIRFPLKFLRAVRNR